MRQETFTLSPKSGRDDVSGFQAMSPVKLADDVTMTVSIDGADDDTAGHLIWFVVAAAVALTACDYSTTVNVNGNNNTVNPTGPTTTVSPTTTVGVGGGRPR